MADANESKTRKLEIKKYSNRRYYDTTHSRHLTLAEICTFVQKGHDITVTDAKSGADITAQVLTQIILELETAKLTSFPVPLLVRVIRTNDQLVKDFIEKYFNQALGSFLSYQQQVEEQLRRTQGLPASFPSVAAWTKTMLGPLASVFGGGPTGLSDEAAPPPPAADEGRELRGMVESLQRQVAALKKPAPKGRAGARRLRRVSPG